MQELEHAHSGRDIRLILQDAYRDERGIVNAAKALGIDESTFSKWVKDLGGKIRSEYRGEVRFPELEEAVA